MIVLVMMTMMMLLKQIRVMEGGSGNLDFLPLLLGYCWFLLPLIR